MPTATIESGTMNLRISDFFFGALALFLPTSVVWWKSGIFSQGFLVSCGIGAIGSLAGPRFFYQYPTHYHRSPVTIGFSTRPSSPLFAIRVLHAMYIVADAADKRERTLA
ncbi:hypothetical protein B0T25DRAFT_576573 [Lasiosphaeria hispida]|uniref:Uncharacterized protein n=1 Tax=Lasiosphaeria hispida TaxID=260671 RepID=A0AAJ0HWN3_9PEZI|nr:hypothetical protein B0T25DRAFT_576573 [Lasiosphaeria hispida]